MQYFKALGAANAELRWKRICLCSFRKKEWNEIVADVSKEVFYSLENHE
jgi:hypothetical protein